MSQHLKVSRFFTIPVHDLYGYFIDPHLLMNWCYPEGMSLKVARIDPRVGGKYHFEHTTPQGTYTCDGHIRKFIRNEVLRMVDDVILDPKGKVLATKIDTDVKFTAFGNGAGIEIVVTGFPDEEFARDCERSWNQCLNHLQDLVKDSGIRQFNAGNFDQGLVQT